MAMAVLGIDRQAAAEQTDAITIIHVAAVLFETTVDRGETIAGFERVRDVVISRVLATRRADLFLLRGRHHLLCIECASHQNAAEPYHYGHHLRKNASLLDPWIRTWHVVQR